MSMRTAHVAKNRSFVNLMIVLILNMLSYIYMPQSYECCANFVFNCALLLTLLFSSSAKFCVQTKRACRRSRCHGLPRSPLKGKRVGVNEA